MRPSDERQIFASISTAPALSPTFIYTPDAVREGRDLRNASIGRRDGGSLPEDTYFVHNYHRTLARGRESAFSPRSSRERVPESFHPSREQHTHVHTSKVSQHERIENPTYTRSLRTMWQLCALFFGHLGLGVAHDKGSNMYISTTRQVSKKELRNTYIACRVHHKHFRVDIYLCSGRSIWHCFRLPPAGKATHRLLYRPPNSHHKFPDTNASTSMPVSIRHSSSTIHAL